MKYVKKDDFMRVYLRHQPNWWTLMAFALYSTNLRKKPTPYGSWVSLISFIVGTVGMIVFDQLGMQTMARVFCSLYALFVLWGLVTLPAFIMNNIRHRRAARQLGLTLMEYNQHVNIYIKE
jgi:Zn-dependent membrane protease YugP